MSTPTLKKLITYCQGRQFNGKLSLSGREAAFVF
jgi:hypothetical protein